MIVVGEDYGEGASVIQERTHAYALKSSMWLLDPRPSLPTIVRCTEKAFELSEATNTPVMMELRIRAATSPAIPTSGCGCIVAGAEGTLSLDRDTHWFYERFSRYLTIVAILRGYA